MRKIKILGYPFAGGQGKSGVELTPQWIAQQPWFKNLIQSKKLHVEFEVVPVTSMLSNSHHATSDYQNYYSYNPNVEAKNEMNVMKSSSALADMTYRALREGFYPIVLGGDHSQAIGSIAGMKKALPNTKIMWMDAHIDANTPSTSPSKNAHGMPLAYLSGEVPGFQHLNCVDLGEDLCYFGIRSYEPEEAALIEQKGTLVFDPSDCRNHDIYGINRKISEHFHQEQNNFWFSFDIDGLDSSEFKSTGTCEGDGLSLDFTTELFKSYMPQTIGMDLTEVNFSLTNGLTR